MPTSSDTSLIEIRRFFKFISLFHYFNVFISCWRIRTTRTNNVIDIFTTCFKPVAPQLNIRSWLKAGNDKLCTYVLNMCTRHSTSLTFIKMQYWTVLFSVTLDSILKFIFLFYLKYTTTLIYVWWTYVLSCNSVFQYWY